jgi:proton glutamate symport protein
MAALFILFALIVGISLGVAGSSTAWGEAVVAVADPVGGMWLNALKMTIAPLVVALLITGITKTAEAARAGRLAGRSVAWFLILLWSSSIMAALVTPLLLNLWPLDSGSAEALKAALGKAATVPPPPAFKEFLLGLIPSNPIAAAAGDAILPLTIFTAIFAFAILKLPEGERALLSRFFEALGNTMLIIIKWVLWLAPIGVFALAFVVGARSGFSALGGLVHYVIVASALGVIVWLAAYPLALFGGRVSLSRFARAALPAQAVAISTQSSLASLPAMLKGTEALGIKAETADVVLPLAVALFRATGPAMNLAVAIYVAHWYGIALGPWQLAAGVAVAATTTLGAVSLPGQLSFISSIAPIALAMGVPFEPLALLIAVETIPDIFRTVGNVSMDMAVTSTIARGEASVSASLEESGN